MGQICSFFFFFYYIYIIKPEQKKKKYCYICCEAPIRKKKGLYLVSLVLRYYSFVCLIKSEHKKGQICIPWYKYVHVDNNGNYISSHASKHNCFFFFFWVKQTNAFWSIYLWSYYFLFLFYKYIYILDGEVLITDTSQSTGFNLNVIGRTRYPMCLWKR